MPTGQHGTPRRTGLFLEANYYLVTRTMYPSRGRLEMKERAWFEHQWVAIITFCLTVLSISVALDPPANLRQDARRITQEALP